MVPSTLAGVSVSVTPARYRSNARPSCRAILCARFARLQRYSLRWVQRLGILAVTDQPEAITGAAEVAADAEKKRPHPYGRKNPDAYIEERQRRLYRHMLNGMPPRALVLDHASRESVSLSTAWRDYAVVQSWHAEDWAKEKDRLVSRLQSMRLRCIEGAIRAKQFGTAQLLLRDLGAVVQEVSPEAIAAAAPVLRVEVEPQRQQP